MQTLFRILVIIGTVAAFCLLLWFSITLIGFMILAGGALILFYAARQFLLDKGILNPTPGVPPEETSAKAHVTIIETEYKELDNTKE